MRGAQHLARGDLPALKIRPPLPGRLFGRVRRDEAREDRSFGMAVHDIGNGREHPLHPRRLPNSSLGKNALHIDAQVGRRSRSALSAGHSATTACSRAGIAATDAGPWVSREHMRAFPAPTSKLATAAPVTLAIPQEPPPRAKVDPTPLSGFDFAMEEDVGTVFERHQDDERPAAARAAGYVLRRTADR